MNKEFNFWLKWSATAITIIFAIMTSMQITPYNVWVANLSSVMWLWWAIRVREWSLVVVNAGLLVVYFAGLFIG